MSSGQHTGHAIQALGPPQTLRFTQDILTGRFPGRDTKFLAGVFEKVFDAFAGRYPGYQACDTAFHDLAHTCQAAVATARILDGHIKSGQPLRVSARDLELDIAGILLHDIGFLKQTGDNEGTGAKYTLTHVDRSAAFAGQFLPQFGVTADEVRVVQLAILCTGANVDTSQLDFHNDRERVLGYALGTGDILGQMAVPDYPDRLPALYREFREAGITTYTSADDLLRQTRAFYEGHVRRMLDTQWGGVHRVLASHFPDGTNWYFTAIEANLARIDGILAGRDKVAHGSTRGR